MKGVILAGGMGTRLQPLTNITNKHLIPIYDRPMIFFPIKTLLDAGIEDIMLITGPEYAGDFMRLLGSGKNFNCRFTYRIQDEAGGISQALSLASGFVGNNNCTVILGDNVFLDNFKKQVSTFSWEWAIIFSKEVKNPQRYGVIEFNEKNQVISIEEKPTQPKSNFAQTGLYIYDNQVFQFINQLSPSQRGELEVTDLNNIYLKNNNLKVEFVNWPWLDAGTINSLNKSSNIIKEYIENGKLEYLGKK